MNTSILQEKSFSFAIRVVRSVQWLQSERKEYVLSSQLLRSGTSVGANIKEAEFAQSRKDFISKMSIALKESNESEYFLLLLQATAYLREDDFKAMIGGCREIKAMLISSIKTAKGRVQSEK